MRTFCCGRIDRHLTEWAKRLRCWFFLFFLLETVQEGNHEEDDKCHDEKINDRRNEFPVGNDRDLGSRCFCKGINFLLERLIKRFEKSTPPKIIPIGGMMMSDTKEATILPKAPPMITPTAMSTTLPRSAKALKSFKKLDIIKPLSIGQI